MSRTKVRGTVIIDNPAFGGIGAIQIPVGTTTQRDAGFGIDGVAPSTVFSKGMLRYNSTDDQFEGYDGAQWAQIAGGGGGGGSTAMAVQKFNGDNTTVTFNLVPTDLIIFTIGELYNPLKKSSIYLKNVDPLFNISSIIGLMGSIILLNKSLMGLVILLNPSPTLVATFKNQFHTPLKNPFVFKIIFL